MLDKELIKKNIFYKAHPIVDSFPHNRWHRYAYAKNSSQALAIDVFGFLKLSESKVDIINSLFNVKEKNWDVDFEFSDENLLNENKYPTCIDVKLESKNIIILLECKFTEKDGGTCSQTKINKRIKQAQCNGNYELQINPINIKENYCALNEKDIKYWDYISKIYKIDTSKPISPCPFKNGNYQWMRNLCTGYVLNKNYKKDVKVYICYADFPFCAFKRKIDGKYIQKINSIIRQDYHISTITYQRIIDAGIKLSSEPEHSDWLNLKEWIEKKGDEVSSMLKKRRRK